MRDKFLPALKAAFPHTIPIMTGFWFLSLAYGIYMNVSGFNFLYPTLMALTIFGGSLEFLAVTMLLSPFAPVQAFLLALMVQARHLFYGISMLDKYKGLGWKKWFLMFGLCDETFSINFSTPVPEGVDRGWFYLCVSWLDHLYWVLGALMGGLIGSLITFDVKGIDFIMTAMFVAIFMDQWKKEKNHVTAFIGIGSSVICLLIFGADKFMIPTMATIVILLTVLRKPIENKGGLS